MGKFKDSDYYKSEKHIENAAKAGVKGRLKMTELKEERMKEYYKNPKLCKECKNIIPYDKKNEKSFCDSSCAAKYNNKNRDYSYITEEYREKVREKTIEQNKKKYGENYQFDYSRYNFDTFCSVCNKSLTPIQIRRKNNRKKFNKKSFCSNKCKASCISEETKEKISLKAKERVKNGTHKGWQSRNILSYPEKFFIKVLYNNNMIYEHNLPISKRSLGLNDSANYFLDFYFKDKKIDLEIDGKQHTYDERKDSDETRDKNLIQNGIKVYRIKWREITSDQGKEYMKNEIDKFLMFFKLS